VVHDAGGGSLVIEFDKGEMNLHDNPIGVMTNGPEFTWHLTNMNNYTFLTNVDQSSASFGGYRAVQPDSGIATAGLPASNTSVGRFVRAAFYAQYAEKAQTADEAVRMVGHIMNNFDRPRGITIDYPSEDGGHLEVAGLASSAEEPYATEYTCWTNLSDLARKRFHLRSYQSLNFVQFDLAALAEPGVPCVLPLAALDAHSGDQTALLIEAKAA
jgi:penicillin V acylase-like amidase (Ntn superfamily)